MANITTKDFFNRDDVKGKFQELLGKRSSAFITSVLQIVAQSEMLAKVDPASIYQAAAVAATLDLPLNSNLGFAYIVPYKDKAQFQMGYRGYIQLAQRTGLYKTIAATPVYEGQLVEQNPLTGFKFDFTARKSDKVVGYAAFFQLLNGFEKTLFMTVDELKKHGKQYSQTFKKGFGLWEDNFDAMATKTVLKLLLAKFAPLSIEMQRAVITDQAVILENEEVVYVDNEGEEEKPDKVKERVILLIADAKTPDQVESFRAKAIELNIEEVVDQKLKELKTKTTNP